VTDAATLDVVVAVLAGLVNKTLVAELTALGAPALGLSGADGATLQAKAFDAELGLVGHIGAVDPHPIQTALRGRYLPVIAPIAVDATATPPQLLNTNADTAAGAVAAALHAEQLIFLTDVAGVLDEQKQLMPRLSSAEAGSMIERGVVTGGMIPKLEAAIEAAADGCTTRIVDGTAAGALTAALAGDGGTIVSA
jgi:acetylglutamate kinase